MYVVAFFKVMQQQSIGEVANPITYYDISEQIIFVCYSERIICQSYAQMKKVQFFFWLTVYNNATNQTINYQLYT